jgi:hypothetical protein
MNADIPYLRCKVRNTFLTGGMGCEDAYAFAISSVPGRALAFHVMLKSGAHYRHLPIHALCTDADAPDIDVGDCMLWDCFTFRPEVTVFSYLRDHQGVCRMRNREARGTYLFTVDWLPDSWERPGWVLQPDQNKCAHVMELDEGNLCALPTNRIQWIDGYYIGEGCAKAMRYRTQEDAYHAEDATFNVATSNAYAY